MGNEESLCWIVLSVVAPLMHAHLLTDEIDELRRTVGFQIPVLTKQMHGNRGFMRMRRGPDDVLGSQG